MKQIQGSFLAGYVTIRVKGNSPELFFEACMKHEIPIWNIHKESPTTCIGNVKLKHVPIVKQVRRHGNYQIKFIKKRGFPFVANHFFGKKELVISLFLSCLFILFLSNIVWKVDISGVPQELEEKINKRLVSYGIHSGIWIFTMDSPGEVQRKLENDVPELLWVGIEQKGTTFLVEGVEKLIVEKDKEEGPSDIVAAKKGVIKKMYISKGQPQVAINDFVEQDDLLVAGNLVTQTEDDEPNKKRDPIYVASEGEIIANTWYELTVAVPLQKEYDILTGDQKNKYYLKYQDFHLPIWGGRTPDYSQSETENRQTAVRFLKWDLPIYLVESIISEKQTEYQTRSKDEAIDVGIEQAKKELLLQLGEGAEVISHKVLHEATDRGKVKLTVFVSVEENIAKHRPISNKR